MDSGDPGGKDNEDPRRRKNEFGKGSKHNNSHVINAAGVREVQHYINQILGGKQDIENAQANSADNTLQSSLVGMKVTTNVTQESQISDLTSSQLSQIPLNPHFKDQSRSVLTSERNDPDGNADVEDVAIAEHAGPGPHFKDQSRSVLISEGNDSGGNADVEDVAIAEKGDEMECDSDHAEVNNIGGTPHQSIYAANQTVIPMAEAIMITEQSNDVEDQHIVQIEEGLQSNTSGQTSINRSGATHTTELTSQRDSTERNYDNMILHKQIKVAAANAAQSERRFWIKIIVAAILLNSILVSGVVVAGFCGSGACGSSSETASIKPSHGDLAPTQSLQPTASPTLSSTVETSCRDCDFSSPSNKPTSSDSEGRTPFPSSIPSDDDWRTEETDIWETEDPSTEDEQNRGSEAPTTETTAPTSTSVPIYPDRIPTPEPSSTVIPSASESFEFTEDGDTHAGDSKDSDSEPPVLSGQSNDGGTSGLNVGALVVIAIAFEVVIVFGLFLYYRRWKRQKVKAEQTLADLASTDLDAVER